MMIRKMLLGAVVAAAMLAASASGAFAATIYYGGWYYDDNPGGWDVLQLGDSNRGRFLHLVGTEVSCGTKGAPYARIHQVLSDANDASDNGFITWWITNTCDSNYDRICVQNDFGATACSTYQIDGWYNWRDNAN